MYETGGLMVKSSFRRRMNVSLLQGCKIYLQKNLAPTKTTER